jgi:hypothetical protein
MSFFIVGYNNSVSGVRSPLGHSQQTQRPLPPFLFLFFLFFSIKTPSGKLLLTEEFGAAPALVRFDPLT